MNSGRSSPGNNLSALYRDSIRRHAADPTGFRRPIASTHRHEAYNPLCGDRVEIGLRVLDDTIEEVAFDGEACAICMASASLLCGLAPGRTAAGLQALGALLHEALATPLGDDPPGIPEDLHALLGVRPYPSRIRCATLPWEAALQALTGPAEA